MEAKEYNYTETIEWRLRLLMGERRMTLAELSALTGIKESAIGNWTRGYTLPRAESIIKLANAFGVSCDYILGQTENRRRNR